MMARPRPTRAYHFTHVSHLASIMRDGLVSDSTAQATGRILREVGNQGVKARRREAAVDVEPGGVVADYVPFYFTPRNLMLFQIHTGRVPTYEGGQECLVFLCVTLERVAELKLPWVVSDRNAAKALATFTADPAVLDDHVDWSVATTSAFNRTEEDPDRPERHQAELLVHRRVPWEAVQFVGTRTQGDLAVVQESLATLGGTSREGMSEPTGTSRP